MSAQSLVGLRSRIGLFAFIDAFSLIGRSVATPREAGRLFASAADCVGRRQSIPVRFSFATVNRRAPINGWELNQDELELISWNLGLVSERAVPIVEEHIAAGARRRGGGHAMADVRRVAVVYGRNESAKRAMFRFLRALGLDPIEWSGAVALTGSGSPYVGQVLDGVFGSVQAVVVILTGDDVARLGTRYQTASDGVHELNLTPQARPNVLFEAGMAFGRHPDRTILVELGSTRSFSDVAGRHVVRMTNDAERRKELASRLHSAGCPVDLLTRTDWLSEGDFDATNVPPDL